jgi:hypothetical protein
VSNIHGRTAPNKGTGNWPFCRYLLNFIKQTQTTTTIILLFHGGNTGSIPVGRAIEIKYLAMRMEPKSKLAPINTVTPEKVTRRAYPSGWFCDQRFISGTRTEPSPRVLVEKTDPYRPQSTCTSRENEMMKALVVGAAALVLSAGAASAQVVYPGYGYAPYGYGYGTYGYGYGAAAPLYDYAGPAYGYGVAAPLYNYAAPGYGVPAQAGTTVVIVTPGAAYAAPPVASGYYNYAPGYWGGYGGYGGYGGWRAGYWR